MLGRPHAGWRVICTVSYWSCYVIFESEDREPECYGVHWDESEEGVFDERSKALQEKLDELKSLIVEREEYFSKGQCFF